MLWFDDNQDGAISFLAEGIKLNPGMAELYYQMAAFCFMKAKVNKGVNYLENGLLLDPSKHQILLRMAPELKTLPLVKNLIAQYVTE
jgi:hypothetical protein